MVLPASLRMLARLLVVATAALAVSCGNGAQGARITVGAGDSIESGLLAEIYAGALARTGARTSIEARLGGRADYLAALDAGRVDLVGEHNGALLAFLDTTAPDRTPDHVRKALSKSLPEGLVVTDAADGTDLRPRVVLGSAAAARDNVRTVGDLVPRCGTLTIGVAPVPDLIALPPALEQVTDCAATVRFPDAAALRKALLDGQVHAGLLTGPPAVVPGSTDGLTILSDADYALRAENVLPLFRKGVLDEVQIKKLNYVAGELTTDELAAMIRGVRDEGAKPAELARKWLDDHSL
ncbi:glycine betaine ABC transporter substrate-binding protein [Nocardia sp. CS682]|uniref:glycine betaine ABC transporter substrate-binding protein n=1 Tax=Nocardia sp. CS682 TaxID=1047172 RepID=UPI001074D683|nr:glycine betaine ABC transporter substrate-binding protein [Nocardia sp. CS682]QBS41119.1 transporter [Nocardia sp. CS682]